MTEETRELIRLAQTGDRAAAGRLTENNNGLIWSVARRFFDRGVEPDDLYQLACVGFLKAVQGFDLSFGTEFSTYAVPKISGEIRRFLRDDGAVKVSRGLKERGVEVWRAKKRLAQSLGREPTVTELSEELGIPTEDVALADAALAPTESLQRELGDSGVALEQLLGDGEAEDRLVEHLALGQAVEALEERERMVISLRFYHDLTQDRTARILGVSQVQISRLERRALGHLRELMNA